MNTPNLVTLLRIILVPIFVMVFYIPGKWNHIIAAMVFLFASISDWLDGYLARTLNQTSKMGAFLDPVADKLMIAVALVLIVGERDLPLLALPASVIVGREIAVSALREWMAEIGKRASVAVSRLGKYKTFIQMISLIVLILYQPGGSPFVGAIGYTLLTLAAILTLWSGFLYLKAAWPDLSVSQ